MKFKNLKSITILFTCKNGEDTEFIRNINVPFIPDICVFRSLSMSHSGTPATHIFGLRTNLEKDGGVVSTFRSTPSGTMNNMFMVNNSALQQATFQLVQATYPPAGVDSSTVQYWSKASSLGNVALSFVLEFYEFDRPAIEHKQ